MRAVGMYIVVKTHVNQTQEMVSPGGVVLPNQTRPYLTGTIESVGDKVEVDVSPGDVVVLTPRAQMDVSEGGDQSLMIFMPHDIVAVIEPNKDAVEEAEVVH